MEAYIDRFKHFALGTRGSKTTWCWWSSVNNQSCTIAAIYYLVSGENYTSSTSALSIIAFTATAKDR
ncbi:hypothetical protein CFP56_002051 [Quercus suber]|uniref:Uncharacterized protein n=1 Tax=Quercus suber TaxID=58331 RepID=A0AAW0IKM5_QUESU